ncbi:MAG: DNA polymerase III subunit delta [Gammaproteobacteria bacterium]|nr:DNA polymerase III subunit delta [Gammaproteobacteria bacterium]
MRLKAEQLAGHLQQNLLPIYVIFGDEQMLVEEAGDLVRQRARQMGADDRQVWHVEGRFNWSDLQWQEQTMSLFSSQRLIEIRLPSGAPGKEGGEALRRYVENPPIDTTLLIISGKIDTRSQKSKWFTELDRIGAMIPIWPVDLANLPRWISQRMQQRGLRANQQVFELIAERVEGNLFAAAQEIDKLQLLCPNGDVDEQTVLDSVADNARFEAFGLMDTVLSGQTSKIPRMISRLRAEGLDILAVFSAVSWSLHRMVDMAVQLDNGARIEQVFSSQKPPIWEKSRPMMRQALGRHERSQWQAFLQQMAQIDQAAKGAVKRCPWTLLETLCLQVAGINVISQN